MIIGKGKRSDDPITNIFLSFGVSSPAGFWREKHHTSGQGGERRGKKGAISGRHGAAYSLEERLCFCRSSRCARLID